MVRSGLLHLSLASLVLGTAGASAQERDPAGAGAAELRVQSDQAHAVLDILSLRERGAEVPDSAWTALFASEGYRRTLEREHGLDRQLGIDRGFSDASFRSWAESEEALEDLEARRVTLAAWDRIDPEAAALRALAYLPRGARLLGTIYPIVRKQENSFVWGRGTDDPAIFMSVEPGLGAEALEHTLAHEFHHIGSARACPARETSAREELERVYPWLGGFAEGVAVLAAAGGPGEDTHPFDGSEVRDGWSRRLDSLAVDMRRLEQFFFSVASGELEGDEASQRGMSFINSDEMPQGPFYSVGWHMAATVEREAGREAVVASVCDPAHLLLEYNRVAARRNEQGVQPPLPVWSTELLRLLAAEDGTS